MVFTAVFLRQVFDIDFLRPPGILPVIYAAGLLVILYGYAWIFAVFTEAHTNAIRSRLSHAVPVFLYRVKPLIHSKVFEQIHPE